MPSLSGMLNSFRKVKLPHKSIKTEPHAPQTKIGHHAETQSNPQESTGVSFKDIFVIFFMILCFSLVAFTGGLLVGRQLTLEEMSVRGVPNGQDEPVEDVLVTEARSDVVDVAEEVSTNADPESLANDVAKSDAPKQASDVDIMTAEERRARTKSEKEFLQVEEKKIQEFRKERSETSGVPKEVSGLFEGGEAQRVVASRIPAKPTEAAQAGQNWTLQVGAYPTEEEARQKVSELRAKGLDSAYLEETTVKDKGTWYRVGVGFFPGPKEAQELGQKLKLTGLIGNFFARRIEKK